MNNKTHKNEVKYNPFKDAVKRKESYYEDDRLYPYKNPKTMEEAATVSFGDRTRMKKLIKKAMNGEDIHIVTIGGSITEGSGRSEGEYHGDLFKKYFTERFPKANVKYTNCGRGTTTTLFGSARIQRDLEPLNPDFVVVEYAVNNVILDDHIAKESFEGCIRKILNLPTNPCVFVMFMCLGDLSSSMPLDIPISLHYDLPMSSFADGIKFELSQMDEVPDGYVKEKYIFDDVHPTTLGYRKNTDYAIFQIEKAIKELDEIPDEITPIPDTFKTTDRFINAHIINRGDIKVVKNNGFNDYDREDPYLVRGFETHTAGSEIVFEVECKILSLTSFKSLSPRQGSIKVQIDDKEPFVIDGYFHNGWGNYNAFQVIIDEAETKTHRVSFKFDGTKNPEAIEKAKEIGIPQEEVSSKFYVLDFIVS